MFSVKRCQALFFRHSCNISAIQNNSLFKVRRFFWTENRKIWQ